MDSWPDWLLASVVVLPTVLVSAVAGWPVTAWVLRSARVAQPPVIELSGNDRTPVVTRRDTNTGPEHEVLRGGTWIGILERTALTAAIMAGRFELAAVVVAIKALGRYPEIRENPVVSERFIIGTLTSLLVAGSCGTIGTVILNTLNV